MARTGKSFQHPTLGRLFGLTRRPNQNLIYFHNIPYGEIPQHFARATLIQDLPQTFNEVAHDGTDVPPASIQPHDSGKTDCKGNQFPEDLMNDYKEQQSGDCLRLNIIKPESATPTSRLPVLVHIHGGAFFIGSSTRPYHEPATLCEAALRNRTPHIFVSINYRLGVLGFFHSPETADLMPANNSLHDQRIAFEWIRRFIGGFGGDFDNITTIGQSAGGMSLTIHNLSGQESVWKRSIQFSGSLVTMPVKTPEAHQENFLAQAKKLGLKSDIGFFAALLAQARGCPGKSYLLLFDLGNPFEGFFIRTRIRDAYLGYRRFARSVRGPS
ncbi:hypothetical protein MBLNU13_g10391t1 [Cladosporium sp. NU13]